MNVDTIVGKQADEPTGAAAAPTPPEGETKDTKAEAAAPATAAAEAKPDGVLAKDGQHVIPYSQLESARARAAAAEALARSQAEELVALKAAKTAPAAAEAQPDADMLTAEELEALEADSPTLAKTLRAQQAQLQQLRDTVNSLATRQAAQVAGEEQEIKSEIQTAIDANPTLAEWQTSEDQTLWNEASRFDKMLRSSPKYANVSFKDRFEKVVELTQRAMDLEPATPSAPIPGEKALTAEEIKAAAQAKLTQAARGKRPVSLSDIPGGAPPAVDERQKVEDMSMTALGNQFLGMSKDQIDAYLASL
jgi:hypothetical protein